MDEQNQKLIFIQSTRDVKITNTVIFLITILLFGYIFIKLWSTHPLISECITGLAVLTVGKYFLNTFRNTISIDPQKNKICIGRTFGKNCFDLDNITSCTVTLVYTPKKILPFIYPFYNYFMMKTMKLSKPIQPYWWKRVGFTAFITLIANNRTFIFPLPTISSKSTMATHTYYENALKPYFGEKLQFSNVEVPYYFTPLLHPTFIHYVSTLLFL